MGTSTLPAPLSALAVALIAGCSAPTPDGAAVASGATDAARSLSEALPRIASETPSDPARSRPSFEPRLVPLPVPGYRDAVVALPVDGTERQGPCPVVVAVHGNYDHVEPFCDGWSRIAAGRGFVLCPRGIPRADAGRAADRWSFGWNGRDLEREIDAGLRALVGRYGSAAQTREAIFAGFSLGAILGAEIVLRNPSRYPRAALVEGGGATWSRDTARRFHRGGGRKLLFGCGHDGCVRDARPGMYWSGVMGFEARTAFGGNVGHTFQGTVGEELARHWSWLTDGDPAWGVPSPEELARLPVAASDPKPDTAARDRR